MANEEGWTEGEEEATQVITPKKQNEPVTEEEAEEEQASEDIGDDDSEGWDEEGTKVDPPTDEETYGEESLWDSTIGGAFERGAPLAFLQGATLNRAPEVIASERWGLKALGEVGGVAEEATRLAREAGFTGVADQMLDYFSGGDKESWRDMVNDFRAFDQLYKEDHPKWSGFFAGMGASLGWIFATAPRAISWASQVADDSLRMAIAANMMRQNGGRAIPFTGKVAAEAVASGKLMGQWPTTIKGGLATAAATGAVYNTGTGEYTDSPEELFKKGVEGAVGGGAAYAGIAGFSKASVLTLKKMSPVTLAILAGLGKVNGDVLRRFLKKPEIDTNVMFRDSDGNLTGMKIHDLLHEHVFKLSEFERGLGTVQKRYSTDLSDANKKYVQAVEWNAVEAAENTRNLIVSLGDDINAGSKQSYEILEKSSKTISTRMVQKKIAELMNNINKGYENLEGQVVRNEDGSPINSGHATQVMIDYLKDKSNFFADFAEKGGHLMPLRNLKVFLQELSSDQGMEQANKAMAAKEWLTPVERAATELYGVVNTLVKTRSKRYKKKMLEVSKLTEVRKELVKSGFGKEAGKVEMFKKLASAKQMANYDRIKFLDRRYNGKLFNNLQKIEEYNTFLSTDKQKYFRDNVEKFPEIVRAMEKAKEDVAIIAQDLFVDSPDVAKKIMKTINAYPEAEFINDFVNAMIKGTKDKRYDLAGQKRIGISNVAGWSETEKMGTDLSAIMQRGPIPEKYGKEQLRNPALQDLNTLSDLMGVDRKEFITHLDDLTAISKLSPIWGEDGAHINQQIGTQLLLQNGPRMAGAVVVSLRAYIGPRAAKQILKASLRINKDVHSAPFNLTAAKGNAMRNYIIPTEDPEAQAIIKEFLSDDELDANQKSRLMRQVESNGGVQVYDIFGFLKLAGSIKKTSGLGGGSVNGGLQALREAYD